MKNELKTKQEEINKLNEVIDYWKSHYEELKERMKNLSEDKIKKTERERCLKIIEELGEERNKNNELILIKLGNNFLTNSVKMLKEELTEKVSEEKE